MRILADPYTFGVKYLLVSHPSTVAHDQVRTIFPTLYENGAGIATLVRTWDLGSMHLRLYRVDKAVTR